MTRNGDGSSRLRSSFNRVTEKTSNGPQKSRTSTSGKMRIPTVCCCMFVLVSFRESNHHTEHEGRKRILDCLAVERTSRLSLLTHVFDLQAPLFEIDASVVEIIFGVAQDALFVLRIKFLANFTGNAHHQRIRLDDYVFRNHRSGGDDRS